MRTRQLLSLLLYPVFFLCSQPVVALSTPDETCSEALSAARSDFDDNISWRETLRMQAECYLRGLGGAPKDRNLAKSLLVQSAQLGSEGAAHMLASMRLFESDDPAEQRLGLEVLRKEHENGSAFAAGKIGYAYHKGLVVEASDEIALSYYTEAASGGMTRWQFILSRIYEAGLYGQAVDASLAKYWRDYQPKVHVEVYPCVMAALYQEDLVFEPDAGTARAFQEQCSATRHLEIQRQLAQ